MATDNVFEENQEYLIKAREMVTAVEDLRDDLEAARLQQKKMTKNIAQEEKSVNEEIASTLKRRKDEIADSYDKQIDTNNSKIRRMKSKKDKKKNERMEARIENETAELCEQNRQLKMETKTMFKQNHVPAFCNSDFYYCLFAPKGASEIFRLFLMILGFCVCLPTVVIFILLNTKFSEGTHTAACILIAAVIVIAEFIIYFVIFNFTKVKHRDFIAEGRKTRNTIRANEKAIKAIKNSITKDKDESVYNLGKYDDKIKALEAEGSGISGQKMEALKVFEAETKQVITDEIIGRRQPKVDSMKEELKQLNASISSMEEKLSELELTLTDKYETYLGKDLCTEEKLSDLISIMEDGSAGTVSEAIKVYKGDDK
ncbi:MAG: hypothetical protein ACI4EF_02795 [Coprococcus sp.]